MPTLAGNKHPSVHFFLRGPRFFHFSTEKVGVRSVGKGHQSVSFPRRHSKNLHKQKMKEISIGQKYEITMGK